MPAWSVPTTKWSRVAVIFHRCTLLIDGKCHAAATATTAAAAAAATAAAAAAAAMTN